MYLFNYASMKDGKPRGWFIDENGQRKRWTGLGNVWVYTSPFWKSRSDKQVHPAQKPVDLLERIIRISTKPGDTVVDFFAGSGSTGVAAKRCDRNYILFENNQEHFNSAQERLTESLFV